MLVTPSDVLFSVAEKLKLVDNVVEKEQKNALIIISTVIAVFNKSIGIKCFPDISCSFISNC